MYPVITAPPLFAGAVNETEADVLPNAVANVAETFVGESGTWAADAPGTTPVDSSDTEPAPTTFVAVTVQKYRCPFVRADTTTGLVAPDAFPITPPSVE